MSLIAAVEKRDIFAALPLGHAGVRERAAEVRADNTGEAADVGVGSAAAGAADGCCAAAPRYRAGRAGGAAVARPDGPADGNAVAAVMATSADAASMAPTAGRLRTRRATSPSPFAILNAGNDFTAACPPKRRRLGSAPIVSRDGGSGQGFN